MSYQEKHEELKSTKNLEMDEILKQVTPIMDEKYITNLQKYLKIDKGNPEIIWALSKAWRLGNMLNILFTKNNPSKERKHIKKIIKNLTDTEKNISKIMNSNFALFIANHEHVKPFYENLKESIVFFEHVEKNVRFDSTALYSPINIKKFALDSVIYTISECGFSRDGKKTPFYELFRILTNMPKEDLYKAVQHYDESSFLKKIRKKNSLYKFIFDPDDQAYIQGISYLKNIAHNA